MDSKQCEIDLKSVTPLQGFFIRLSVIPGRRCALPWANMLRPFRPQDGRGTGFPPARE